ncbi:Uncharacterised protein [Mycobacteroides abscessus subsp. abscessus]|nr:Uncharacterised protein [Mycobacteroides abscessus subsp. abscessus]
MIRAGASGSSALYPVTASTAPLPTGPATGITMSAPSLRKFCAVVLPLPVSSKSPVKLPVCFWASQPSSFTSVWWTWL